MRGTRPSGAGRAALRWCVPRAPDPGPRGQPLPCPRWATVRSHRAPWLHAVLSQSPRVTVARIAAHLGPIPWGHRAPCRENFTSSRGDPAARAAEAGTAGQLVRPASVPDPALPVGASWERAGAAGGSLEPARGCAQAGGVSAACVGPSEDAGSAAPPGRWVPGPAALPSGERRALPPGGRQEAAARAHPARRRGPGGGGTACPSVSASQSGAAGRAGLVGCFSSALMQKGIRRQEFGRPGPPIGVQFGAGFAFSALVSSLVKWS